MPEPSPNAHVSTRVVRTPTHAAIARFCVTAAHEKTQPRAREQQPHAGQHRERERDDDDAVPRQHDVGERFDAARHERGIDHLHVLRAEERAHALDQHEADAPGREQRFERTAVEPADHRALEHHADDARDAERRPAPRRARYQSNAPGR